MRVITFGKRMIRLHPRGCGRFARADHLEFSFGGGSGRTRR